MHVDSPSEIVQKFNLKLMVKYFESIEDLRSKYVEVCNNESLDDMKMKYVLLYLNRLMKIISL